MPLDYHLLDVFTDRPFGGNPLAVFPDAHDLDEALMRRIAAELNLSETAFVLPPVRPEALCRLRIFTPRIELPFAGHPTVGVACLLASLGRIDLIGGDAHVHFEEAVGLVRISMRRESNGLLFAQLTAAQPPERRTPPLSVADAAALLRVDERDIGGLDDGPESVSAGVPFLLIPIRSVAALQRVEFDAERWRRHLSDAWAPHVVPFCRVQDDPHTDVRVRMFSPPMGIAEDPATGAAAAALGAYLAWRTPPSNSTLRWTLRQGIEIGRPSELKVEVDKAGAEVAAIRVGGSAVEIGAGRLTIG